MAEDKTSSHLWEPAYGCLGDCFPLYQNFTQDWALL